MNTANPDHDPRSQPDEPERRTPPPADLDPALLEDALAAIRRDAESGDGYGTAFLAYLDLVHAYDAFRDPDFNEEADFCDRYVGHYPDRGSFVRWAIHEHGWGTALAEFQAEQGMEPSDLAWDEGVLWDHLAESYGLIERFGGVHAFRL